MARGIEKRDEMLWFLWTKGALWADVKELRLLEKPPIPFWGRLDRWGSSKETRASSANGLSFSATAPTAFGGWLFERRVVEEAIEAGLGARSIRSASIGSNEYSSEKTLGLERRDVRPKEWRGIESTGCPWESRGVWDERDADREWSEEKRPSMSPWNGSPIGPPLSPFNTDSKTRRRIGGDNGGMRDVGSSHDSRKVKSDQWIGEVGGEIWRGGREGEEVESGKGRTEFETWCDGITFVLGERGAVPRL
jgi:hypothetical protein